MKETSALLDEQLEHLSELSDNLICPNYYTEVSTLKQIALVLSDQLSQKIAWLSENLNQENFEIALSTLHDWSATMSNRVKKHYYDPPETVLQTIENVSRSLNITLNLITMIII